MAHRGSISMVTIDYPWTKTKEDAAAFYNVEETKGLSEERVKRDLERYGPNGSAPMHERRSSLVRLHSSRATCRRGKTALEAHLRAVRRSSRENSTRCGVHFIREFTGWHLHFDVLNVCCTRC